MTNKIAMDKPIVEMNGDEMAKIMWDLVKKEIILPYVDLKTEYYDLSLENRDKTLDQVTKEAGEAIKEHTVGAKCATITPDKDQVTQYNLQKKWDSPNGTIRGMLDGTTFRVPLILPNVTNAVRYWDNSVIHIARHSFGDDYKGQEIEIQKPGNVFLMYVADDGEVQMKKIARFSEPGIASGMYNLESSIRSFAKACIRYSFEQGIPLMFNAKHTIRKIYDGKFKDIFDSEVRDWNNSSPGKEVNYAYSLIDAGVAKLIRLDQSILWALKNYDGDVQSDLVGAAYGSIGAMTSNLISPNGWYNYEAAHGTVAKHYKKHLEGQETSTNSTAIIAAWGGALQKRGELDNNPDLQRFGELLVQAPVETIKKGLMTNDLYKYAKDQSISRLLNTLDFIYETRNTLDQLLKM